MTDKERAFVIAGEANQCCGSQACLEHMAVFAFEHIDAAVKEERERCIETVDLFCQFTLADPESAEADALRDKIETLANDYRINDNAIHGPIGLMAHAWEKRVAEEREAICQLVDDNDHMGTTELIETIRKRGQS